MTAWDEWKERCAVALCSPASQTTLQTFGGMRFRTLARRCLPLINVTDVATLSISDGDAWHLLEVHMTLPDAINGKAYKQWLFSRTEGSADSPFDVVQGGATLLMRWVVREHLRSEYLPADHLSLNQPPTRQPGSATTLCELLPGNVDARCQVEQRELAALAEEEAKREFPMLPHRSRLALAGRHQHIPFSDRHLQALADSGRTGLQDAYHQAATQTIDRLRERHPNDDPATVRELGLLTFDALTRCCLSWATKVDAYRDLLSDAPLTATREETTV